MSEEPDKASGEDAVPEASTGPPDPAFLDTNCIVRYLTDDPPEMAEKAAQLIDSAEPLIVSELVVAETAYVLESVYEYERSELVDALMSFIQRLNIRLLHLPKPLALEALSLCRGSKRYSFTDALLWAEARHFEAPRIFTFDRRFPTEGLEVTEPPSVVPAGDSAERTNSSNSTPPGTIPT